MFSNWSHPMGTFICTTFGKHPEYGDAVAVCPTKYAGRTMAKPEFFAAAYVNFYPAAVAVARGFAGVVGHLPSPGLPKRLGAGERTRRGGQGVSRAETERALSIHLARRACEDVYGDAKEPRSRHNPSKTNFCRQDLIVNDDLVANRSRNRGGQGTRRPPCRSQAPADLARRCCQIISPTRVLKVPWQGSRPRPSLERDQAQAPCSSMPRSLRSSLRATRSRERIPVPPGASGAGRSSWATSTDHFGRVGLLFHSSRAADFTAARSSPGVSNVPPRRRELELRRVAVVRRTTFFRIARPVPSFCS